MIPSGRPDAGPVRLVPHLVALSFGMGLASSIVWRLPGAAGAVGVGLGIGVVVFGIRRNAALAVVGLVVGAALLGATWGAVRVEGTPWAPVRATFPVSGILVVQQTAEHAFADDGQIVAAVEGLADTDGRVALRPGAHVIVRAEMSRLSDLGLGTRVRVAGVVRPVLSHGDPEWWRAHLERRGIVAEMRSPALRVVGRRDGLSGVRDRVRERLRSTAVAGLSGDRAAVVRGMALGGGQTMSQGTADEMRAAGVWHLMAVSGQNIALVAIAVTSVLAACHVRRRRAAGIAICAIVAYCLVCDGGASVARAGIMGVLVVIAQLTSRVADRWYLLIVGLDVLLAIQPRAIGDPGLQLSFAAVVGLLLLSGPLGEWLQGFARPAVAAVTAQSVAASIATAPVSILRFGEYSLVGLVANVVAVPVAAPTVILAMAGAVVSAVAWPLGLPLTWCAGVGADVIRITASAGSALPGATARPGWSGAAVAVTLMVAVPLVARRLWHTTGDPRGWVSRRRRRLLLRVGAPTVVLAIVVGHVLLRERPLPWPLTAEAAVIDIGQGDAILLRSPDGRAALVDTGPPGEPAPVVRALRRMGVRRLDLVALTHHQSDHDGALPEIVSAVDVGMIATSVPARAEVGKVSGGRYVAGLAQGQTLTVGEWTLAVLWPPADLRVEDPNDASLVLHARAPGVSVLLTGDAEGNVLTRAGLRQSDVLKVSHHGSDDPDLMRVLAAVRPRSAVISVGAGNEYGHPTPATLATLSGAGVRVFRTDRDGTVRIRAVPGGVAVGGDRRP